MHEEVLKNNARILEENTQLRTTNIKILEDNAQLKQDVNDLKKEVARLKGLKGPPDIKPNAKPSGMEKDTSPKNKDKERTRRGEKQHRVADHEVWMAHLEAIGLTKAKVAPNPVQVATESALWGSVKNHGFLQDSVILSDDAGQFNVGIHALCWVHAERLLHKLNFFTDDARNIKEQVRDQIWSLYKDLKAYKEKQNAADKKALRKRFDKIFGQKTGITAIDRLLGRLRANKPELLRILDYPDIPLHTNGSENDIRCHVTRRKVSGTTRSDEGRDARDAFLSLKKTCMKLDISFWVYLGDRLGILPHGAVPPLSDILAARAAVSLIARCFADVTIR